MTIGLSLPFHIYGYIDRTFLSGGLASGWDPAVWFGLTVPVNRAVGLTVLLENGAQYRELPPHAWAFAPEAPAWTLPEAQAWDCFGGQAQTLEYTYLRELPVRLGTGLGGAYLFTLEWAENGFSRDPGQSKSFHFIELENGRLTIQPNDRLRWHDASFTNPQQPVAYLRRQATVWGVETWPPEGS